MATVFSSPAVTMSDEIALHMSAVRKRISDAARRSGRNPADITVVAVSKTVAVERLHGALQAGVTDLGENRVQEAAAKIAALGHNVTWHLIGHLQRNKTRVAVELFDLIHSVDSLDLATTLDRQAGVVGKRQRVLFQVNVSGEASKGGFTPDELRANAARLAQLAHLQAEGLMTIAPLSAEESELRTVFGSLRALRDATAPSFPDGTWRHLSMGMSDDYEIAIEEGATLVRIGRAIFGARPVAAAISDKATNT